MIDIRCHKGELETELNDLASEDTLETAVLLSLFTDAYDAESGERGWWGDLVADTDGDRFGSRLWLLDRAKKAPGTLRLAEDYAREALAWLIADGAVTALSVSAKYLDSGPLAAIGLTVTLTLPGGLTRAFGFANAGGQWL